jgi:hypothetical protein
MCLLPGCPRALVYWFEFNYRCVLPLFVFCCPGFVLSMSLAEAKMGRPQVVDERVAENVLNRSYGLRTLD